MKSVIPTGNDGCILVPFPSTPLAGQCQKLNTLHDVLPLFQPGTPNPIAGLSVIDLEEAIKGNPNSIQLQPPQDLLHRYYVS
jgi:uncharacterized membrane protein